MPDTRAARKAAEKAARERLAGPLIAAVGELGAAAEAQRVATDGVTTAQAQAREHVTRAKREAEDRVAAARRVAAAADNTYTDAHAAATEAGWGTAALADMGYPSPAAARRPRRDPAQPISDSQPPGAESDPPAVAAELVTAAPTDLLAAAPLSVDGSA